MFFFRFFRGFLPIPKQILIFTAIFLICGLCAFSQEAETGENDQSEHIEQAWLNGQDGMGEKRVAIGLGLEQWNMNSRHNFAGGAVIGFDVDLPYYMATGATFTASHNFGNVVVLEPAALFRWYAIGMKEEKPSGLFVQADVGAYIILEDGEVTPLFSGGLRLGYRQLFDSFYIEPYGRGGYPYMFGVGLAAGVKF
jgi:hypothetical protein